MSTWEKRIEIIETHVTCDLCPTDIGILGKYPRDWRQCSLCKKDICLECTDDNEHCEDGQLCKGCAVTHQMESSADEGVGIMNRKTGKYVNW